METEALIRRLAADKARPAWPMPHAWWVALGLGSALAAIVFLAVVGPREDLGSAFSTLRFPFKFLATVALAASAFVLLKPLSRPGGEISQRLSLLLAAPLLVFAAVLIELVAVPPGAWSGRLIGTNRLDCLVFIPLMGIAPLAMFLLALRHGAPTRPRLAGAVAGLLAGGVAATFYAAHCPDDSPLFVATWYSLAIAALSGLGALLGPRVARW